MSNVHKLPVASPPPSDLDLEAEVLSRGFISEHDSEHWRLWISASEDLFFAADNKVLFRAQQAIAADGKPLDPDVGSSTAMAVRAWIKERMLPMSCEPTKYIMQLVQETLPVYDSAKALLQLSELARQRALRALVQDLSSVVDRGERLSPSDMLARISDLEDASLIGGVWSRSCVTPEALLTQPRSREWLLRKDGDGAIPIGCFGLILGQGGAGKSFLVTSLALAIASGRSWLDTFLPDRTGKVLLAMAEETSEEVQRRIYYAANQMELTRDERAIIAANVHGLGLRSLDVSLTQADGSNTSRTRMHAELKAYLSRNGPWSAVILDPLSRFAGAGTEIDNAAATRFAEALESLTEVPGKPTVIVSHHTPQASRNTHGPIDVRGRGVTGIEDAARFAFTLGVEGRGVVRLTQRKSSYGPLLDDVLLVRDSENYGSPRAMSPTEVKEHEAANAKPGRKAQSSEDDVRMVILDRLSTPMRYTALRASVTRSMPCRSARFREIVDAMLAEGKVTEVGRMLRKDGP